MVPHQTTLDHIGPICVFGYMQLQNRQMGCSVVRCGAVLGLWSPMWCHFRPMGSDVVISHTLVSCRGLQCPVVHGAYCGVLRCSDLLVITASELV